ncbi:MAG: glycosyltransferase [Gammaproteobacteria bacterium]
MRSSRTVLLVAFHFPPMQGSSGVQRTLRFSQHLPKFGWRPVILSIDSRAYGASSEASGNEVPPRVDVHRAFGVDAARTLSMFGRYPRALALPDRWASWRLWAVPKALRIIREEGVDVIWSTFPIATAHLIGLHIARRSGLPWVAEFRDPMWQGDYPPDAKLNRAWRELETQVFGRASRVVVTTPGAVAMYADRFPALDRSGLVLIENGYDEEAFGRARADERQNCDAALPRGQPVRLLHSGIIYPSERDPTQLFGAVASLKRKGAISAGGLQIVLRASGHEPEYRKRLDALGIADIVSLQPPLAYTAALREMLDADGLLILQASNCNAQVPAKLYEYLRAEKPILALTDPSGDTARTLSAVGAGQIARLDSQDEIEAGLLEFLRQIAGGRWRRPSLDSIRRYSREVQTGELAAVLDQVAA